MSGKDTYYLQKDLQTIYNPTDRGLHDLVIYEALTQTNSSLCHATTQRPQRRNNRLYFIWINPDL